MNLIAKHPYVKTERKLTSTMQFEVDHDRFIYLYHDKVVTKNRQFPIENVIDFSFREIKGEGGILYLHTIMGLYTYVVKTSPEKFIASYKHHFK